MKYRKWKEKRGEWKKNLFFKYQSVTYSKEVTLLFSKPCMDGFSNEFFSVFKFCFWKRTSDKKTVWSIWRSHSIQFCTCIKYLWETFELTTQLWTKRSIALKTNTHTHTVIYTNVVSNFKIYSEMNRRPGKESMVCYLLDVKENVHLAVAQREILIMSILIYKNKYFEY